MMSGIRGHDTKPELQVRSILHRAGFRFRLRRKDITGSPDLLLPRHRTAIFVHGCFWHGHTCHLFKMPSTRQDFWEAKIRTNRARDDRVSAALRNEGWRRLIVWECALKGRTRLAVDLLTDRLSAWLKGAEREGEIAGLECGTI